MGYNMVYKHKVSHEYFRAFHFAVSQLEHKLGDLAEDDFWKELLREVKYYRFIISAAPVPVNYGITKLRSSMKANIIKCSYSYPNYVEYLKDIVNKLSILSELNDNPLLNTIEELMVSDKPQYFALLLKESYLIPLVKDVATNLKKDNIEIVNSYQLKGSQCYNELLIVGPSYWYPNYILNSPRATKVHLIRYAWMPDKWMPQAIFVRPYIKEQLSLSRRKGVKEEFDSEQQNIAEVSEYDMSNIVLEINWKQISNRFIRHTPDDHNQELLPAKLYLLAGNFAVFLAVDEDTKVFVLDLDDEEEDEDEEDEKAHEVKHIPIFKVRSGTYLLLRTEGGGEDYILVVADKMLQPDTTSVRAKQSLWKTSLKNAVATRGLFQTCCDLIDCGSEHANEINVRNWMSSKTIRPRDDRDFRAILRFVGLSNQEHEYQEAAKRIKTAHKKAGNHIRKMLIEQVMKANLEELYSKGYMDFELPEAEGGSLTAFRIEHISPEVYQIPSLRIGRPIAAHDKHIFLA